MEDIENPYRWQIWGALITMLIGALGFAAMAAPRYLPIQNLLLPIAILTSAAFLFMFGLAGLAISCWQGYNAKKAIGDILAGNHLVRWRYDPDEWHRIAEAEWARAKAEA